MIDIVNWSFPLLRPHTGMMFGNGATGLLVWGEGNCLKITVGRADFWDHRGGMSWTAKQSYAAIRKCLENNDAEGIKNIFATDTEEIAGQPPRPSVIPAGRLEFMLPAGAILQRGTLNLQTGTGTISYLISGVERRITILMSMNRQEFCVKLPCDEQADILEVPSEQYLAEYFRTISINPPVKLENAKVRGWIQALPADPALCIGYRRSDNAIWGVTVRGNVPALEKSAAALLDDAVGAGFWRFTISLVTTAANRCRIFRCSSTSPMILCVPPEATASGIFPKFAFAISTTAWIGSTSPMSGR